jgi:radical SAM protein with 4Fe4S-binding SPASM domain
MQRAKKLMPMDLFKKIIDEAATISRITQLTLTGLGETLLDRHLDDRIRYARSKMPDVCIDLYTNGSQLTLERGLRLVDAGITVIYVSLNAATADKRKAIMQLDDFDKVVANTHALIDELKRRKSLVRVIVKAVVSKDLMEIGDTDIMIKEWGGPWDQGGNLYLHQEGSWGNGAVWTVRVPLVKACSRALDEIMIMSDGRVSACCFDGEGDLILGDIKTQTIREVYAGEKAVAFRQAHNEGRRQEYAICKNCTGI